MGQKEKGDLLVLEAARESPVKQAMMAQMVARVFQDLQAHLAATETRGPKESRVLLVNLVLQVCQGQQDLQALQVSIQPATRR
jgi:hypothetical protein